MLDMLLMPQWLTLMVLVLKILCCLRSLKKFFSVKSRNAFSMLIFTFWLYGGLNHIFLRCLLFNFSICLSLRLFSYDSLAFWNYSSLYEASDKCLFIIFGSSFVIVGRWFDFALIEMEKNSWCKNESNIKKVHFNNICVYGYICTFFIKNDMFFLVLPKTDPLQLLIAASVSSL